MYYCFFSTHFNHPCGSSCLLAICMSKNKAVQYLLEKMDRFMKRKRIQIMKQPYLFNMYKITKWCYSCKKFKYTLKVITPARETQACGTLYFFKNVLNIQISDVFKYFLFP